MYLYADLMTHLKIEINPSLPDIVRILAARFLSCLSCLSMFTLNFIIIFTTLAFHLFGLYNFDNLLFHTLIVSTHIATPWTFIYSSPKISIHTFHFLKP